jgi:DNA-directed RNA polymerase specialized sigma subunit
MKGRNCDLKDEIANDNESNFEAIEQLLEIRKRLNLGCQEILDLRFDLGEADPKTIGDPSNGRSFEEIAKLLGLNEANARQRFKRCFDKLREFVFADPELLENLLS